eukprot:gene31733-41188_t
MSKGYTDQELAAAAWRKQQKEQENAERRVVMKPTTNIDTKFGNDFGHRERDRERTRNRSRSRSRSRSRLRRKEVEYPKFESTDHHHNKNDNIDVDEFGREIRVGVKRKISSSSSTRSRSNRSRSRSGSSSRVRSHSRNYEKEDWEHDKFKDEIDDDFRFGDIEGRDKNYRPAPPTWISKAAADLLLRSLHGQENGIRGKTKGSLLDFYHYFYDGEVKTYQPDLSKELRSHFGFSESYFRQCMNIRELECVSSDSKSGQTFWRSSDGTLVVKTIKGYECRTMRKILATYANHVTGNLSCLSGVLGLYRVATPATVSHRYYSGSSSTNDGFVDRNNNEGSGLRYDLKGSTYGRQKSSSSSVLKDLDLIYSSTGSIGELGYAKSVLLDTLHRDCNFLEGHSLMDYSLLVEVERSDVSHYHKRFPNRILDPVSRSMKDRGKLAVLGSDGRIYHFGIIDFLQR